MASSLSFQIQDAYDKSRFRAAGILKQYQRRPPLSDPEEFQFRILNSFFDGVHTAFSESLLASLQRKLRTRQQMADALGLKDGTSISKMRKSGTMDGARITAALYLFRNLIPPETRQKAALHGFARATSFVKAQILDDDSIEGTMIPQDFAFLAGMLASDKWELALRNPDPTVARNVAIEIVTERTIDPACLVISSSRRAEQSVLMLQEIHETWADYVVLALWAIPECIPTEDSGMEVAI